jgi:hypothetical protein
MYPQIMHQSLPVACVIGLSVVIQGWKFWVVENLLNRPWIGDKQDPKQMNKTCCKWEDCQGFAWIWCRMLHCRRLTQLWPRSGPILRSTPRLGARALNGDSKLPNLSLLEHSHGFPLKNIPLFFVCSCVDQVSSVSICTDRTTSGIRRWSVVPLCED